MLFYALSYSVKKERKKEKKLLRAGESEKEIFSPIMVSPNSSNRMHSINYGKMLKKVQNIQSITYESV